MASHMLSFFSKEPPGAGDPLPTHLHPFPPGLHLSRQAASSQCPLGCGLAWAETGTPPASGPDCDHDPGDQLQTLTGELGEQCGWSDGTERVRAKWGERMWWLRRVSEDSVCRRAERHLRGEDPTWARRLERSAGTTLPVHSPLSHQDSWFRLGRTPLCLYSASPGPRAVCMCGWGVGGGGHWQQTFSQINLTLHV